MSVRSIFCMLAVACCVAMSAQVEAQENKSNPFGAGDPNTAAKRVWAINVTKNAFTPASKLLRSAADAVQNAKGDEEKATARKKLNELVDKCFDDDMVQRQKELEQLEKRLSQLREQLDRRKNKKSEIVDLQLKVLLNEADGLGFFSSAERGGDSKVPMINSPYGLPIIAEPGDLTPFFNAPTPTPTAPSPPGPAPVAPRAAEAR